MKISIITATYNSSATLRDTLDSILRQTYQDYEVIIQDGMSTDDTLAIARSYESRFGGRLKIFSEKDNGLYDAMNRGIGHAAGDVVGILNSDDFFADNDVLRIIHDTMEHGQVDCVYGNLKYVLQGDTSLLIQPIR